MTVKSRAPTACIYSKVKNINFKYLRETESIPPADGAYGGSVDQTDAILPDGDSATFPPLGVKPQNNN